MAVYVMRSTDTGAPTLSGTTGELVTLLDALLVNGYNSKTITITRSGATATASCTSHGFNTLQTVKISGADQAEYNGEFRVLTTPDANTFTFTVSGSPATPATGTITCVVAPLGFSTAYTATNKRAYQQKAGTNQFYLRVTDDGTGSASYGRVVGYETMSDIDTGTNAFPTAAQFSGGLYWGKSSAASATQRAWRLFSDGKIFYLCIKADGASWTGVAFGDFKSHIPGDVYNTVLIANSGTVMFSAGNGQELWGASYYYFDTGGANTWVARNYAGAVGCDKTTRYVGFGGTSIRLIIGGGLDYPLAAGGASMPKIYVMSGDPATAANWRLGTRGELQGFRPFQHQNPTGVADGDTFTGGGDVAGKQYMILGPIGNNLGISGYNVAFEISDTWSS